MRGHRDTYLSWGWRSPTLAAGAAVLLTSAFLTSAAARADTRVAEGDAAATSAPAAEAPSEQPQDHEGQQDQQGQQEQQQKDKDILPAAPRAIEKRWRDNAKVDLPPTGGAMIPRSGSSSLPRSRYRDLIEKETSGTGLPPEIAEAVMGVESGYNAGAIGGVGEIGLMQILPSTARMLGFVGSNAELATPENNVHYGVTYLAQAWRLAGGDLCTAVMKYRAGHGETRFSHLSVSYCLAVRSRLSARGYHVTGTVPVATFGDPAGLGGGGGGGCRRKCLALRGGPNLDYAKLNAHLTALVVQVRNGR